MFSKSWKASKKPSKQRKYVSRAPLHIKSKMLVAHLADDLAKKIGRRSARVRKGDRVKVMKGQFSDKTGKVDKVDLKNMKVFVEGLEIQKKEGTKVRVPVAVSSIMITELDTTDKKRLMKRK